MQNANMPEQSQTKPEVPKDRAEERDTKPLKLEAEPVEERLLPYMW